MRRLISFSGQPRFALLSIRTFTELFDETEVNAGTTDIAAFAINADNLQQSKTFVDKKAHGVAFHISDAEAVDAVCRHHGTSVELHGVERYMMPFWLAKTAAGGSFRAELLQRDPAFLTQPHSFVWIKGPHYEFSYPFGEFMPMNQVCASYVEPLGMVERCVTGSHVPSMLISRFELVKELEQMKRKPKVVPFAMSTTTALTLLEKRVSRRVIMDRIGKELQKFHGSFASSNITVTSLMMEAVGLRPVFLPLIKLIVSTASSPTRVPALVCGATGRVVGPVLHVPRGTQWRLAGASAVGTLLSLAPLVAPGPATAAAIGVGAVSAAVLRRWKTARFLHEQARQMTELQTVGLLNLASDSVGYRWTPEQEEQEEYEYREELRQRARKKAGFEQRVKEEAARDHARAQGRHFDARNRRRTDLVDVDPLGYYELLGLKGKEFTATPKEISKAFRDAARVHHPDVNRNEDEETLRRHMQTIIEAYRVLHDPKTKKAYDAGEMQRKPNEEGESQDKARSSSKSSG